MAICEGISDEAVKEIVDRMQDHVENIQSLTGHSILVEEGGRMVILVTSFPNRESCLTYHASREYRQFVAATQHLLIGNYVIKLFQNRSSSSAV
jgi:hypothetical protein